MSLPTQFRPQLASLVADAPGGDDWLHEVKLDGYRIGCRIDRGEVTLLSRRNLDWTRRLPEIRDAAARLPVKQALLDGEAAILMPDGRTGFQALQRAIKDRPPRPGLVYFAFDLLYLDGRDLSRAPLEERKAALRGLLGPPGVIRYSDHIVGGGPDALREACRLGLEGLVSKRRDAPYVPGRTTGWLKAKCVKRQELVIGGFSDPEGSRQGIASLLVGYYQDGTLVFAGKVGTGFSTRSARELRQMLDRLEQKECPFEPRPPGWSGKNAHWVRPELVAEVKFTEWTADGLLRHPSFLGLREDRRADEIVREEPIAPRSSPAPRRSVRMTHPDAAQRASRAAAST